MKGRWGGCRSPIEADSEIIRAAVLLDELDAANPSMEPRHIVVQVKTMNSLQTLSRVCSSRIMALHTGQINARRLASHPHCRPARTGAHVVCYFRAEETGL